MEAIRYAQCWEDADVLIRALDVRREHNCLVIASAGDNALALLSQSPRRVVAIDFNPAQIACLELRVAAYTVLDDRDLLQFLGARPAQDRFALYAICRHRLSAAARDFWDVRKDAIDSGVFSIGKLERYLKLFRLHVLPLVEGDAAIDSLLTSKTRSERAEFFEKVWDNWRWRILLKLFFSRQVMSTFGRDRAFFAYADADVSKHLLQRIRHALVELDPAENPYLHWVLKGIYGEVLPFSLRPENVSAIRRNIGRLTWEVAGLEAYLEDTNCAFDRFALSDVFEYMSPLQYERVLRSVATHSKPGAKLVYWNMIVPRTRPEALATTILTDRTRADALHSVDKAFFYSNLVIESVA